MAKTTLLEKCISFQANIYLWCGVMPLPITCLRAAPALHANWAGDPSSKPEAAPTRENWPRQALGPTSPGKFRLGKPNGRFCLGKPNGRFRLGFSPRTVTSALTSSLTESNGHAPRVATRTLRSVFFQKSDGPRFFD
ncbi:unnamed protein product [Prunus armeniaca]